MQGGRAARLLVSAVCVLVAATGLGSNHAEAKARVVAFGDSYVHPGAAGVKAGQRPWVALLREPVRNLGHAGDPVAATLARVRRAGSSFDVVIVEVGINDVRRYGDAAARLTAFRRDYAALLDRLAHAQRVVVVPPLPVLRWGAHGSEAALLTHRGIELSLAASHRNVVVADPLALWRPDTMVLPDGLHPNAAGRALLAATVRAALAA